MTDDHPGIVAAHSPHQSARARLLDAREELEHAHIAVAEAQRRIELAQLAIREAKNP